MPRKDEAAHGDHFRRPGGVCNRPPPLFLPNVLLRQFAEELFEPDTDAMAGIDSNVHESIIVRMM